MNYLKFLIFLVLFFQSTEQAVRACKTEILRSLGYHSNLRATRGSGLCPNIKFNCCTKHDEMKMHKLWNTFTKRRIQMRHKTSQLMLTKLNTFIGFYGGIDIPKMQQLYDKHSQHKHPEELQDHLKNLSKFFLKNPSRKFLIKLKLIQGIMNKYFNKVVKLRGYLNCSLCNWSNHKFIDVNDQEMFLQGKFCLKFAQLSIDPVAQKYMNIYRLVLAFDEFIFLMYNKHLIDDDWQRKKLQRNLALTQQCANSPNLKTCAEYCKDINFNEFSMLFDGEVSVIKRLLKNINTLQDRINKDEIGLYAENYIEWTKPLVRQTIKKSVLNGDFGVNLKVPLEEKQEDDPKDIKLKLNLTKITKVIFKDHIHHPLQIESLDSEIDSFTLYKIKEHPIDINAIQANVKMFGINPISDAKKTAIDVKVHTFLARLHHGKHDTHDLDEEIDKRLDKILKLHKMDDFANYQNDNIMKFKKFKSKAERDAMMAQLKALKTDFKNTVKDTRILLENNNNIIKSILCIIFITLF